MTPDAQDLHPLRTPLLHLLLSVTQDPLILDAQNLPQRQDLLFLLQLPKHLRSVIQGQTILDVQGHHLQPILQLHPLLFAIQDPLIQGVQLHLL